MPLYFSSLLIRSLSTASTQATAIVHPPLRIFSITGRYVTALYSAANKTNKVPKVGKDITDLQSQFDSNPKLLELSLNPSFSVAFKKDIFSEICRLRNYDDLVKNMLTLMVENGRIRSISTFLSDYSKIIKKCNGEIDCTLTTAQPLSPEALKEITAQLEKFIEKQQKLILNTKVDPEVLGGMKIQIGAYHLDLSIASRVKQLMTAIEEN